MDRWGFALLCALLLALSLRLMPTWVDAAHNGGTFGTFTSVSKSCSKGGCDWSGTFVSHDGTVHRSRVTYDGGGLHEAGGTVEAQWLSSDPSSVYPPNDNSWLYMGLASIASAAYLSWWAVKRRWRAGGPKHLKDEG